ncbi:MAG: O-antigen ligase family protein [Candidatus Moranbacteria bacterium]|nr:O-antigen ligase family protein [Candidatus Moranbacteria bacterium]
MSILLHLTRLFLFLLPFQVALSPVSGIDLPLSRVFAPLLFLFWLARGLSRKKVSIPLVSESAFLFVFLFLSFISIVWAEDVSWAGRRMLFLLSFYPLFLVYTTICAETPFAVRTVFRAVVAGAALAACVGLVQFFSQFFLGVSFVFRFWMREIVPVFLGSSFGASVAEYPSLLVNVGGTTILRASSFFPDPHVAAFFFGIAFPFSFALAAMAVTRREKVTFLIFSILILLADLLSFSRGGYVGLMFGVIFAGFRYVKINRLFVHRGAILLGLSLIGTLSITPIRDRLVSSFVLEEGSNAGRIGMYTMAIRKIAERPFGYGLANYPLAVKMNAGYREPIYAHDLYLDIATETGIAGAAVFLAAIVSAFWKLARSTDPMRSAAAVSLVIFFGHSLFETPLYSVHVLPMLLLLLALASPPKPDS